MEAACSAMLAPKTLSEADRRAVVLQRARARFGIAQQSIERTQNRITATAQGFADIDSLLAIPALEAASKAQVLVLKSQGQRALLPGGDALAEATLAEALRVHPDDVGALWVRAGANDVRRNYTASLADWDRLAKLLAKDPAQKSFQATALNQLCRIQAAELNRDYAAARAHCDQAIAVAPTANYYDSRGMVGLREQDYLRAYADYSHAVELDPKNASALYGLGIAERRLGRTEQGDAHIAAAKAVQATAGDSYTRFGITP
jgi:tetratricopeptide (TPR) repeat protein